MKYDRIETTDLKQVTVQLPRKLVEKCEKVARRHERSLSFVIRRMVQAQADSWTELAA